MCSQQPSASITSLCISTLNLKKNSSATKISQRIRCLIVHGACKISVKKTNRRQKKHGRWGWRIPHQIRKTSRGRWEKGPPANTTVAGNTIQGECDGCHRRKPESASQHTLLHGSLHGPGPVLTGCANLACFFSEEMAWNPTADTRLDALYLITQAKWMRQESIMPQQSRTVSCVIKRWPHRISLSHFCRMVR